MSKLKEYFSTDWAAMTTQDWIGTLLTIAVFVLMIVVYVYALHPKNRDKLESKKNIPLDDEPSDNGENNVGK